MADLGSDLMKIILRLPEDDPTRDDARSRCTVPKRIAIRVDAYATLTMPVLQYYGRKGLLLTIDAAAAPISVFGATGRAQRDQPIALRVSAGGHRSLSKAAPPGRTERCPGRCRY
jgi:hypothetical protein